MTPLASFRNCHAGATIVVCGCGASLNELQHPEQFVTIGVNDVGRKFQPNYLVVVNPRSQFKGDRFQYVESSQAKHIFTQLDLGISHPGIVRFRLGQYGGTDLSDPEVLHYTRNSPYVAVCLAVLMGAKRIGLIGVDFTDDHFFAATGRHPLANSLDGISREYEKLREALLAKGIEMVNLSNGSRLTILPKQDLASLCTHPTKLAVCNGFSRAEARRVFFVHYRFLSCGDVFRKGLMHAARELELQSADAYWDDPALAEKVQQFDPELLFVVHGRRFSGRWNGLSKRYPSAVWLLDEPYEVDDTCRYSSSFRWVFVNDPSTISRHHNASYLPTCYDPHVHFDSATAREFRVGFVGGANPLREKWLQSLASNGLLDYVVGGPWQSRELQQRCRSPNIPEEQTADLYRASSIIVNIFRQQHHFNREQLPATSLNPRIFEALACGALVVSEPRPELEKICPSVPIFRNEQELAELVAHFISDEMRRKDLQRQCAFMLRRDTYAERLRTVMKVCGLIPLSQNTKTDTSHRLLPAPSGIAETAMAALDPPRPGQQARGDCRSPSWTPVTPARFTAMPRRNLIYHIWPVRDSVWRWNLEQLLQRVDIFNGRRVVGIVYDSASEPPEAVMDALAGHGFEFVVRPNGPLGEAITFPEMMAMVASDDANEVTFYGHAKGVKYGRTAHHPVRQWTEALYTTSLDNWLEVWEQLQHFAMTGPFRMKGRFRSHHNSGDWHYSGTFFWFRHAHVFRRAWQEVPQFYCGVEAWPGTMFRAEETGCLFMDGLTSLPYHQHFWRMLGNAALKNWDARRRRLPVPDDLANPSPPAPEPAPRMEQLPGEFRWLAAQLIAAGAQRVLTIGALHGGFEWWLAREYHQAGRTLELTVLEISPTLGLRQALQDAATRFNAKISLVEGSSRAPELRSGLPTGFDAAFIDADHRYAGVRSDWELARRLKARRIAFHDIVDSHWHVQCRCCVSRLWAELRNHFPCAQEGGGQWGGVGLLDNFGN